MINAEDLGVVTVCNKCGRERKENELFGAECKLKGCDGVLAQHEDKLHLTIRHLTAQAEARAPVERPAEAEPKAKPKTKKRGKKE